MKVTFGEIQVIVPFSIVLMLLYAGVTGQTFLLWMMAALIPHELGHILAARRVGARIESLKLMPFGASIRMFEPPETPRDEMAIAAGGPLASVIAATLCAGLLRFLPEFAVLEPFIGASLVLAASNCLPALPLDGGRVLRAVLGFFFPSGMANRISCMLGFIISGCMLFTAVYLLAHKTVNVSLFMIGIFLLSGSMNEWSRGAYVAATAAIRRQSRFKAKGSVPLRPVAVHESVLIRVAIKQLKGASILHVMDDDMRMIGSLAEGDLLRGMMEYGSHIRVGELVRIDRRGRA